MRLVTARVRTLLDSSRPSTVLTPQQASPIRSTVWKTQKFFSSRSPGRTCLRLVSGPELRSTIWRNTAHEAECTRCGEHPRVDDRAEGLPRLASQLVSAVAVNWWTKRDCRVTCVCASFSVNTNVHPHSYVLLSIATLKHEVHVQLSARVDPQSNIPWTPGDLIRTECPGKPKNGGRLRGLEQEHQRPTPTDTSGPVHGLTRKSNQ